MMKRDISANLYQKCLILCSKILLNVLHENVLDVLFYPSLTLYFDICSWHLICMIQQVYKYVSLSLWPRVTFFELKITNLLKSRVDCHGNRICYSHWSVSCRTISLPSFNSQRWKLAKIARFIYLIKYRVE